MPKLMSAFTTNNKQAIMNAILPLIDDETVQGILQAVHGKLMDAQIAAGPGKQYKIVFEPSADNNEIYLRIWLYDTVTCIEPVLVREIPLSQVNSEHIKALFTNDTV